MTESLIVTTDPSRNPCDWQANLAAKWNGTSWSALGTGTGGGYNDGEVRAVGLDSNGNLYVGGLFFTAGGLYRPYIAKWITAFSKWF